jgi:hypothetical protein
VVLDLSSFKCGHDAPTYGMIDNIINSSGTPASALHDIDANKPSGSIKIRVKTYAHALKLHEERLQDAASKKHELTHRIDQKRLELLELKAQQLEARRVQDEKLRADIEALREKIRAYRPKTASPTQPLEVTKDVIKLGKKNKDGSITRVVDDKSATATSAAE